MAPRFEATGGKGRGAIERRSTRSDLFSRAGPVVSFGRMATFAARHLKAWLTRSHCRIEDASRSHNQRGVGGVPTLAPTLRPTCGSIVPGARAVSKRQKR